MRMLFLCVFASGSVPIFSGFQQAATKIIDGSFKQVDGTINTVEAAKQNAPGLLTQEAVAAELLLNLKKKEGETDRQFRERKNNLTVHLLDVFSQLKKTHNFFEMLSTLKNLGIVARDLQSPAKTFQHLWNYVASKVDR